MRYHFRVSDPSVAPYVPVCKRRVVAIYNSGVRWYDRWEDWGLFIVQFRISGDDVYVNLLGKGETYFEFQTTGLPVEYTPFSQGSISGQGYMVGVVGVTVKNGVASAVLLGNKRVPQAYLVSRIKRNNQVILLDEPVHYYSATLNKDVKQSYARMLYDAWAPLHPHTGLHLRAYHAFFQTISVHTFLGSYTSHFVRDVGYDVAWDDNVSFDATRDAVLTSPVDWPRQTGVQLVKNAVFGDREFAVYVDAFDQVSVFPTSEIGLSKTDIDGTPLQNVPSQYVRTSRVPFLDWVYRKDQRFSTWYAAHNGDTAEVQTGLYDFPELDWKLHPDGTSICAVVYEHKLAEFDTAYFAPFATDITSQGPGTFYPDTTSFDVMNALTMGAASLHGGTEVLGAQRYLSAPGLIEVTITIRVTGVKPEDFELELSCREVRRPTTSQYCTMLAGYSWYDIKAKNYTAEDPKYDARRGDLCVLDLECYGRLNDGIAANLYSLKNLTAGSAEINTFGASSTFTSGSVFSGIPSILASDFNTLSFVFKYRNEVITAGTPSKRDVHFGVSVYTLNRYKHTFTPTIMDVTAKNNLLDKVDINHRAAMVSEFGVLDLMPLNDLRDWTDPVLAGLREYYCRSLTKADAIVYGTYSGNPAPYSNPDIGASFNPTDLGYIAHPGYKYWQTGSYDNSAPTSDAHNWYNNVTRHGLLKPYVLFDLLTPYPGWWQHQGHIIQRIEINPHTTFFTHPNGSWAFFNQSMIYNANGVHIVNIGDSGLGTDEWDPLKMEHCIFDAVSLYVWNSSTNSVVSSSFRELYNQAITKGTLERTLMDESRTISLTDMQTKFTMGVISDVYDPTITYAQVQADWPFGFTMYYKDVGYFSGVKGSGGNPFDGHMVGGSLDLSMGALWKKDVSESGLLITPDSYHTPITFSTCVMITK